jgi:UrcA family protein
MKSFKSAFLVALVAMVLPLVAAAAEPVSVMTVSYNAAELTTDSGTKALYARIKKAAVSVCAPITRAAQGYDDGSGLHTASAQSSCVRSAIAQAVAQIHSPRLAAVFAKPSRTRSRGL